MAGFQLSINGRFWVSTEGIRGYFMPDDDRSTLYVLVAKTTR